MNVAAAVDAVYDVLLSCGAGEREAGKIAAHVRAMFTTRRPIPNLLPAHETILRVLIDCAPRVVTAEHLLAGMGSDATQGAVRTHFAHIRKRRPDIGRHIETIWGRGYRWSGPPLSEIDAALSPGVDPRGCSSLSRAVTDPASVEPSGSAGGDFRGGSDD